MTLIRLHEPDFGNATVDYLDTSLRNVNIRVSSMVAILASFDQKLDQLRRLTDNNISKWQTIYLSTHLGGYARSAK